MESDTKKESVLSGILPVYKPIGMSSHDVVRIFKRSAFEQNLEWNKKIGHAGTLDVFASGVLLLMIGKATKQFDFFQTQEKSYRATARLGVSSSTLDTEGVFTMQNDLPKPTREEIIALLAEFPKTYEQTVPQYSAAKHEGTPLYELARKGIEVHKLKPVSLFALSLVAYTFPLVTFDVHCSSGTYIRQLGVDLFSKLGIDSCLVALERQAVGSFSIQQCCSVEHIQDGGWNKYLVS